MTNQSDIDKSVTDLMQQILQEVEKALEPMRQKPVEESIPLIKNLISGYCKTLADSNNEWIDVIAENDGEDRISCRAGNIRTQLLMMGLIEDVWLCPIDATEYKTKTGVFLKWDAQTKQVGIFPVKPLKYVKLTCVVDKEGIHFD